ncbi:hypothetical protein Glove_362g70 [Diversispora epigaea]|uniref:Uncharacterized protein n=1 Tax=Diversispora epigaea TaxID=1348612 RepID=A0A397H983_9GLOM|nr:hypothetical protein Glove_362g70 [Diversispora epigaea]
MKNNKHLIPNKSILKFLKKLFKVTGGDCHHWAKLNLRGQRVDQGIIKSIGVNNSNKSRDDQENGVAGPLNSG